MVWEINEYGSDTRTEKNILKFIRHFTLHAVANAYRLQKQFYFYNKMIGQ